MKPKVIIINALLLITATSTGAQEARQKYRPYWLEGTEQWSWLPFFYTEDDLINAAKRGDLSELLSAIRAGVNVNAKGKHGRTPLMHAVGEENRPVVIVEALIKAGADVNAKDDRGFTPLSIAADVGNTAAVDALLRAGADVNAKDNEGETALYHAADTNNIPVINLLIKAGAHVNSRNNKGETPLMHAADWGVTAVAKALIDAGADVNAKDKTGMTALMYAERIPVHRGIFHEKGERYDPRLSEALIKAGADLFAKGPQGTALDIAVKENNREGIALLTNAIVKEYPLQAWIYWLKEKPKLLALATAGALGALSIPALYWLKMRAAPLPPLPAPAPAPAAPASTPTAVVSR
jgi:ankyrin repeat protein